MPDNEKRTMTPGTASSCAPGDGPAVDQTGVGARRGWPVDPGTGGGYLGICSVSNFRPDDAAGAEKFAPTKPNPDPRLAELEVMGLSRMWIDIAAQIGVDTFLHMWRMLDANQANWDDTGKLRIHLRRYSSYLRFQRNRYIEQLASTKPPLGMREISRRVELAFGEKLSQSHLEHMCYRRKSRS